MKLEPCPLCGSEEHLESGYHWIEPGPYVRCKKCCLLLAGKWEDTLDQVKHRWNLRGLRHDLSPFWTCLDAACGVFDVSRDQVLSKSRIRNIADARFAAMMSLRWEHKWALKDIAKAFDREDHATILNAMKVVSNWRDTDKTLSERFDRVTAIVREASKKRDGGYLHSPKIV